MEKKPKHGHTPRVPADRAGEAPVAAPNGWDAPSPFAADGHLDFEDPDD